MVHDVDRPQVELAEDGSEKQRKQFAGALVAHQVASARRDAKPFAAHQQSGKHEHVTEGREPVDLPFVDDPGRRAFAIGIAIPLPDELETRADRRDGGTREVVRCRFLERTFAGDVVEYDARVDEHGCAGDIIERQRAIELDGTVGRTPIGANEVARLVRRQAAEVRLGARVVGLREAVGGALGVIH